jgi:hypothetical protein
MVWLTASCVGIFASAAIATGAFWSAGSGSVATAGSAASPASSSSAGSDEAGSVEAIVGGPDWASCADRNSDDRQLSRVLSAYKTDTGAYTICDDYTGWFVDSVAGEFALNDIGGAGQSVCGTATDSGTMVCVTFADPTTVYFPDGEAEPV